MWKRRYRKLSAEVQLTAPAVVQKFNPYHDENGRFTFAPAGVHSLGGLFSRISEPDGGFTYHPKTRTEPKEGFALSVYPERSVAKDVKEVSFFDVLQYVSKNRDLLRKKDHYIGLWHDPESSKVFFDVSIVAKERSKATALALKHDQIAYFDLKEGKSVTVNKDATSGGVVKKGFYGTGTEARTAFARGRGRLDFGRFDSPVQKSDGQGPDSGRTGGSQEDVSPEVNWENVFKFNKSHYPAGAPGGKGGQFAPKGESNASNLATLFTEKERSLPARATQPVNTQEELYRKSEVGLPLFKSWLGEVGEQIGAKLMDTSISKVKDWSGGPMLFIRDELKDARRAKEKIDTDDEGNWNTILDMVRGTIAVDTAEEAANTLNVLRASGWELARAPKNRMHTPMADTGYRDILTNPRMGNGLVTELQINLKGMLRAKSAGHKFYEQQRAIEVKNGKTPKDQWPDADKAIHTDLAAKQASLYAQAWEEASKVKKAEIWYNLFRRVAKMANGYTYLENGTGYFRTMGSATNPKPFEVFRFGKWEPLDRTSAEMFWSGNYYVIPSSELPAEMR